MLVDSTTYIGLSTDEALSATVTVQPSTLAFKPPVSLYWYATGFPPSSRYPPRVGGRAVFSQPILLRGGLSEHQRCLGHCRGSGWGWQPRSPHVGEAFVRDWECPGHRYWCKSSYSCSTLSWLIADVMHRPKSTAVVVIALSHAFRDKWSMVGETRCRPVAGT